MNGESVAVEAVVLWRRLDVPGHDACRLERLPSRWRLAGTAVFLEEGAPARLDYRVTCDEEWRSCDAAVRGWLGERAVDVRIVREQSGWTLDGVPVPGIEDCVDVDLGFTPATNLLPLRRLALAVGGSAEPAAAWLDMSGGALGRLEQRYERVARHEYRYAAPSFGYAATVQVNEAGFVTRYPGLWQAEG